MYWEAVVDGGEFNSKVSWTLKLKAVEFRLSAKAGPEKGGRGEIGVCVILKLGMVVDDEVNI